MCYLCYIVRARFPRSFLFFLFPSFCFLLLGAIFSCWQRPVTLSRGLYKSPQALSCGQFTVYGGEKHALTSYVARDIVGVLQAKQHFFIFSKETNRRDTRAVYRRGICRRTITIPMSLFSPLLRGALLLHGLSRERERLLASLPRAGSAAVGSGSANGGPCT